MKARKRSPIIVDNVGASALCHDNKCVEQASSSKRKMWDTDVVMEEGDIDMKRSCLGNGIGMTPVIIQFIQ